MWGVLQLRSTAGCAQRSRDRLLLGAARIHSTLDQRSALREPRTPTVANAVGASGFTQLLQAVGLSDKTLSDLYVRDHRGEWNAQSPETFPIAVALSGGADSMALMLLLKEFLTERRVRTPLLAITVDHRLRAESGEEAQFVGKIATQKWGVEHKIMACEWHSGNDRCGTPRKSKLQEEARAYRYELLAQACREHGVKILCVAHNLGDQLETVLFRLGRASGINGLAGIAPITQLKKPGDSEATSIALLRPLLGVSKASLKTTCQRFRQPWVEDPSNESLVFDRIRIRKVLEQTILHNGGVDDAEAVLMLQRIAAEAKIEFEKKEEELLQQHVIQWRSDHVIISSALLADPHSFHELTARIISRLVRQVGNKNSPPRSSSVKLLIRDLRLLGSGMKLTLSGCRITKSKRGRELHFQPEQIRGAKQA